MRFALLKIESFYKSQILKTIKLLKIMLIFKDSYKEGFYRLYF